MKEQSEFIAEAIEALDEGFVIFDDNATMVYCNSRYRDMYRPIGQEWQPGTNLEQIARDTAVHCLGVCGDDAIDQWVRDRLSMHRSNPEPFEQSLTNGLCLRVSETNLANGWVVGTRTDITRLREQSRELKESESLIRSIMQNARVGVFTIGTDGVIQSSNPQFEAMFGYDSQSLVGVNIDTLITSPEEQTPDRQQGMFPERLEAETSGELTGHKRDGSEIPIDLSLTRSELEHTTIFSGLIRDITKRKEDEERTSRLVEELLESNADLERFAHVASHDLQAPVRRILAFADLLKADFDDQIDETAQRYFDGILRAANRMNDLIKDLLEDAKVGAAGAKSVRFDAGEPLAQILDNLDDAINASGAWFSCDPMPILYGDPLKFSRLLENLIGNAIKYSSHGVTPKIRLTVEKRGKDWRFDVSDNGPGIEPQFADTIFQPFVRLAKTQAQRGTGIGLSICKKIVEGFGGEIWVESGKGCGSTFCFTIPIADETDGDGLSGQTSNTGDERV